MALSFIHENSPDKVTSQRLSISPTVSYYIRKLLRLNLPNLQSVVAPGAAIQADAFQNLDAVLESLYLEPAEICQVIQEIEKLMLVHEKLSNQRHLYQLDIQRCEERIYWLLGYKYLSEQHRAKILIVDDQVEMLKLLGRGLKKKGYRIYTLAHGNEILPITHAFRPDLILLDVMMPGINGYRICEQLKSLEYSRDIPIVFVSSAKAPEYQEKATAVGGAGYITKPFHLHKALILIEQLIG